MTDEVALRLQRSRLWLPAILALVFPVAFLAPLAAFGMTDFRSLADLATLLGLWLAVPLLMGIVSLFPTGLLLFTVVGMSKHRLIFDAAGLEWRGIRYPGFRRGRIAYEDIDAITGAGSSVLCIFPRQGKTRYIAIKAYENGTEIILQELRARVDPGRFEPEIERSLAAPVRLDRRGTVLTIAAIAFILGGMVAGYYDVAGRANVAWARALRLPLSRDTEAFDIGPDGSLWVLNREGFGDWWETSNYVVYNISPTGGGPWRLPSTATLSPEGMTLGSAEWIRIDATGRPWLGFSIEPRLLYLTEGQWQWFEYPREITDPSAAEPAWAEGMIWIQDLETIALFSIDPVTGDFESFRLGPAEYEGFYFLRPTADGTLLALRGGRLGIERPTAVNRFSRGAWSGWQDLEFGDLRLPEYWEVSDFTSDPEGNLFVLVIPAPGCIEGTMTSIVGRLSIDSEEWDWRELQHAGDCERHRFRSALVVDSRHRLWIQSTEAVIVYSESVFEDSAGSPAPTTLYTTANSGYSDGSLRLGPDGRVWALGTSDPLVWIDATATELPKPLPQSLASVLGFTGSTSILLIVGMGLNMWAALRARRALGRRKKATS